MAPPQDGSGAEFPTAKIVVPYGPARCDERLARVVYPTCP